MLSYQTKLNPQKYSESRRVMKRDNLKLYRLLIIPREARRAEGPPSVARFINLSRGVRARIA